MQCPNKKICNIYNFLNILNLYFPGATYFNYI